MDKRNIHLVFGHTSNTILLQSGLINPEAEDVLVLNDSLCLGPLFDVDDDRGTENRRLWWIKNVYGPHGSESHIDFLEEDRNRIKKLSIDIPRYEAIYLWFGEDGNEKIATARLLHYLRNIQISIFKPDFHNVHVRNIRGEAINPTTLYLMNPADLPDVAKHFYELNTQHRAYWESLWERLLADHATIHIFDKSNNILTGNHRFFDTFLLEKCTREPKSSALIVAQALTTIWNTYGLSGIGDVFLFHRLNCLGEKGTIAITERHEDPSRGRMVFKVCSC
ncbi:DUF1835 domain-containing protein [Parapedobacter sp. 10938]|uniref:DUF1835 domain-containing protein n=1 Tax=Parapedobacter flavus TaxID=3110225 RepID=UPI002DBF2390|nr:DUF1835 domain-containing protein [Parapedobacter sp. 10938]MEC3881222.1 DUF1835 domain-containing protein [Parapedobacter sp. 10938]